MKIGILILCRYNSSRLPGKILKSLYGKPIIQYIIEKVLIVVPKSNLVVCTSQEKSDDPIVDFCKKNGVNYFRGSLDNVAKRFLDCGIHFSFDYLVRINGDNLFLDRFLLANMINDALLMKYNFVTNVKGRTFPKGMSIEIMRTDFYADYYKSKFNESDHYEHVTSYFYSHFDELKATKCYYNKVVPKAAGLQMAIDTSEDFILAEKIFSLFEKNHTEYSFTGIIKFWEQINDSGSF